VTRVALLLVNQRAQPGRRLNSTELLACPMQSDEIG